MPSPYEKNVFVNVPFDDGYRPLFKAIVFAISDCGFPARCSKEAQDGGQPRIEKLRKIISQCKFGVHDISRVQLDRKNRLPRFNMPFELGLFIGAKIFKNQPKNCVIFDKRPYRYQEFLSDIGGQDIHAHNNQPDKIVSVIRDWLHDANPRVSIPGEAVIHKRYKKFQKDIPRLCEKMALKKSELTYNDHSQLIAVWQKANPW